LEKIFLTYYHNYFIKFILIIFSICLYNNIYSQVYTEYEVKAAYIFNFAKFIQWSDDSFSSDDSYFVIGIYGENPFGKVLDRTLKGRSIHNRKWLIKYYDNPEKIDSCHILYVSDVSKTECLNIIKSIKEKPILTIGNNIDEFCELGGIINFTKQYSKYRFEINNNAAIRVKLSISSKLLSLAKIVTDTGVTF
jgi:hypothetical protein